MATNAIAPQQVQRMRLEQQRLTQNQLATPVEIVAWMGAVQAQDYLGTKWALGLRLQDVTDNAVESAFNAGEILRTHVLRPTWHFVTPADIRWLLELTAPRVQALSAPYYRQQGLDQQTLARSNEVIARALQNGHFLTRAELGAALNQAGIATDGLRLGFIMGNAELEAVVCSGPRQGKQFTYALLDERAPQAKRLPREEALAELTRRYFVSHGPATARDFVWWSGLTVADAKAGLAMVGSQLCQEVIEGQSYWFAAGLSLDTSISSEQPKRAFLLPTFDEFLVGFSAFDKARRNGGNLVFESTLVIEGQVMGSWKRTFKKGSVGVDLAPFAPLNIEHDKAINLALEQYAQFVGLPVESRTVD